LGKGPHCHYWSEPTAKQKSNDTAPLHLCKKADLECIKSLVNDAIQHIQQAVCKAVTAELAQFRDKPTPEVKPSVVPVEGVDVTPQKRAKAVDYRAAVLMGKVPDEAGLLLNLSEVAKLMSVSSRTWARLHAMEAVPAPVQIGRTLVRWRLAEIIAWIDSGCPPRSHWRYPEESPPSPKRRK
jgi:predicted DNA-binding transcriptional regulator AlpA